MQPAISILRFFVSATLAVMMSLLLPMRVSAFRSYLTRIPNAYNVPNPCYIAGVSTNSVNEARWPAVGHKTRLGLGDLNKFGHDFQFSAHTWTRSFCRKDSDGDGMTNGEELGDPDCVWQPGTKPPRSDRVSHPGVCDPVGSTRCAVYNSFLPCISQQSISAYASQQSNGQRDLAFSSGRYFERLLQGNSGLHSKNTSLCPMLVGPSEIDTVPISVADAIPCTDDKDCPANFGCVNGPATYFGLRLCCPSTIPGQLSITPAPNTYFDKNAMAMFQRGNLNRPESTRMPPSASSLNRCFTDSPILPASRAKNINGTMLDAPCQPLTVLWWYQPGAATCQPFFAYGRQCTDGDAVYFQSRSECLETCEPKTIVRHLIFNGIPLHFPSEGN